MQAAELRHLVHIERRVQSGDGYEWVPFRRVMAAIDVLSAREYLGQNQVVNPTQARIKTWWLDGVDQTMRIKHGETIYNIVEVLEDNESGRRWMVMPVSRGTNVG